MAFFQAAEVNRYAKYFAGFEGTTYIQRVNTTGGLAPAAVPTQAGQEVKVPYTAEYFFYRATQK